jgi:beta-lactamase regulating signal transducer with metallopeptidase domain
MMQAMDPDFLLSVIEALAAFLFKSTLAFAACAAVSRLAYSPRFRFILWSGFIYGAAVYWLYLAITLWSPRPQSITAASAASHPAVSSFAIWQIPSSWAFSLGLTLRIVGIAYLVAVGYSIFAHLKKHRYLRWVLSFTSGPPAELAETFASVARELHASRSRLLILSGATSPMTFGWVRPVVLLPSFCVEEDRSKLEDILRHELHHVHRWDAIWNELALAARGLLAFHPAIWYAVRKMQFDRELACDLAVVARCPARRAEYAECLVRFARLNVVPETSNWGIDFVASAHHLTVRVHSILAASRTFPRWTRYLRIAFGLTVSGLFLGVAPPLAILLSFAHQPVSNSSFTSVSDTPPGQLRDEIGARRRVRFLPSSARGHRRVDAVSPNPQAEDRPQIDLQPDAVPTTLSIQNGSGPQLRRRGDPPASGNKAATSETIALVNANGKGQPITIKSDDGKQAVQQTATAALGIYKRLSAVDRH